MINAASAHAHEEFHKLWSSLRCKDRNAAEDAYDAEAVVEVAAGLAFMEEREGTQFLDQTKSELQMCSRDLSNASVPFDTHGQQERREKKVREQQDDFWRRRREKFITNTAFATFGRLFLLVPVLIMTLHPTRLSTLLMTSLCIFAFAAILRAS